MSLDGSRLIAAGGCVVRAFSRQLEKEKEKEKKKTLVPDVDIYSITKSWRQEEIVKLDRQTVRNEERKPAKEKQNPRENWTKLPITEKYRHAKTPKRIANEQNKNILQSN